MAHEKDGNIILIVDHGFDSESTDDRDDSKEEFVFRTRGQTEEEPLQLELALKTANSEDDHTNETCEISSHTSSQSHDDVEIGQSHDEDMSTAAAAVDSENKESSSSLPPWLHDFIWLMICFAGIMASFVAYGILLEFATSGGRRLHELSFLFVTSVLGTITAWIGRTARRETISDIPANRFLALGLMSIGSTFCAIRALRYVIFPIQVLARSCKPVPVMLIGTLLGKKYARRKYISVFLVVCGVALFMGGGNIFKSDSSDDSESASSDSNGASGSSSSDDVVPVHQQLFGVLLLVASLFCDGGTGAYEDKLMSIHSMEPFDLMYKFQLSKTLTSGVLLIVFNQWHFFFDMIQQAGIYILILGMCSAIGQVFIFITIAKFGALTASLMSLTRKVTTLTASIVIYNHDITGVQLAGLFIAVGAMTLQFIRPKNENGNAESTAVAASNHARISQKPGYSVLPTDTDEEQSDELNTTIIVSPTSPLR